jgi:dihydrofolate synthase/folylpolyglutamate synthase
MKLDPKKFEIPSKDTLKLQNMLTAAKALGHPELGRKTILVAGTNGKGSVCSYLTHLFKAHGFKVGTHTSPHVVSRTERIQIDAKPISEIELKRFEKKYKKALEPLTYFERMAMLSFLVFRDKKLDIQILEVGLGGRLDATNISSPDISVIAKIAKDHELILGKTLTKIAKEKAGIMRKDRPVFISNQKKEALLSLKKQASQKRAKLYRARPKLSQKVEQALRKLSAERGGHQKENAQLALAAFQKAAEIWGFRKSRLKMVAAMKGPLPLGRAQILRKKPLFLVDGAHNMDALEALIGRLKALKLASGSVSLFFGLMDDKNAPKICRELAPWVKSVQLPHFYAERQMKPEELLKIWKKLGVSAEVVKNPKAKVKALWKGSDPVLVAGSFYLAGEVLKDLRGVSSWVLKK